MEWTSLVQKWIFAAWHRTAYMRRQVQLQRQEDGLSWEIAWPRSLQADPRVCARCPTAHLHRSEPPLPPTYLLTNTKSSAGVATTAASFPTAGATAAAAATSKLSPLGQPRPQEQSPNLRVLSGNIAVGSPSLLVLARVWPLATHSLC